MKVALAIIALATILPAGASAQVLFRMPVSDCTNCSHAGLYPTAYMDLDTNAGSIKDWSCGTLTYDGHNGTDIAIGGWVNMDNGSMQVVAAAEGDVIYTHDGENDRCGDGVNGMCGNQPCIGPSGHCGNGDSNSVAIKHSDGKVSTYLHMITGSVAVHVGDHVTCGQLLGYVGSSGWSTGPHCHFEVDLGGAYLANPDDPFSSTCGAGGTLSYWVDQGVYQDLPGSLCQGQSTTTTTTSTSTTSSTTTSSTSSTSGSSGSTSSTTASSTSGSTAASTTTSGASSGSTSATASSTSGTTTATSSSTSTTTTGTGTTSTSTSSTTSSGGTIGSGDQAYFLSETIPDGTVFPPGVTVVKSWILLNNGGTRWDSADGYKLVFLGGDALGAPSELDFASSEYTDPGRDKTWAVQLNLPSASATYNQSWQMMHGSTAFGPALTVQVVVRPATDNDGDGHAALSEGGDDCDDNDPTVFPGSPEICDGKDNNCNGQIDENLNHTCTTPCGVTGVQTCSVDSNGNAAYTACQVSESAPEICNGLDDDCNGIVDDGAVCGVGQSCRNGQCTPDSTSTSSTTTSGGSTGGTSSTSTTGTSGTTGGGDTAATPAGCGCSSGFDGLTAFAGLLVLGVRRKRRQAASALGSASHLRPTTSLINK